MNRYLYFAGLVLVAAIGVSALPDARIRRQDDEDGSSDGGDYPEQDETEKALGLPSNSKSIRQNLVDQFTCEGRPYGYYADVANECQVFHICHPVTLPDGQDTMYKWSFICPNQTIFDQSTLVCTFPLDALPCEEAPNFFEGPESLNARFGVIEDDKDDA